MESLKECLFCYSLIANPLSRATEGNLPNFEVVTLSLSEAKG